MGAKVEHGDIGAKQHHRAAKTVLPAPRVFKVIDATQRDAPILVPAKPRRPACHGIVEQLHAFARASIARRPHTGFARA